jgi:hypothetical protein
VEHQQPWRDQSWHDPRSSATEHSPLYSVPPTASLDCETRPYGLIGLTGLFLSAGTFGSESRSALSPTKSVFCARHSPGGGGGTIFLPETDVTSFESFGPHLDRDHQRCYPLYRPSLVPYRQLHDSSLFGKLGPTFAVSPCTTRFLQIFMCSEYPRWTPLVTIAYHTYHHNSGLCPQRALAVTTDSGPITGITS